MNKEMLKIIQKEVKKEGDLIGVIYQPTLEECDYLYSKGILITRDTIARTGLFSERTYLVNVTNFVKEN